MSAISFYPILTLPDAHPHSSKEKYPDDDGTRRYDNNLCVAKSSPWSRQNTD